MDQQLQSTQIYWISFIHALMSDKPLQFQRVFVNLSHMSVTWKNVWYISGLVQECSVLAMDILQSCINTLRPRQNVCHFQDDIFKCVFFNENVRIPVKISLKFVPKGSINNTPALVQIMAWRRSGDKPLSEPMMVSLSMHICVTRPQWVKTSIYFIMI